MESKLFSPNIFLAWIPVNEEKSREFEVSFSSKKSTARLQRLQTPSKKTIFLLSNESNGQGPTLFF